MPFPNDKELMKTAAGLVAKLQSLFGTPAGKRPGQIMSHMQPLNILTTTSARQRRPTQWKLRAYRQSG